MQTFTVKSLMSETLAPLPGAPNGWEYDLCRREVPGVPFEDVLRRRNRMRQYAQDNAQPGTFTVTETMSRRVDLPGYRYTVAWTDTRDGSRVVWSTFAFVE